MRRRSFFKAAFQGATKAVVQGVELYAEQKASRWFRPPFALPELAFLLTCTRCDRCIEACTPGVLFRLSPRVGPEVAATPAMDLLNKGCPMCAGWPCVAVCEPRALVAPDTPKTPPPAVRLAQVSVDTRHCLPYTGPECGACGSVCPVPGALRWAGPRPSVETTVCTGCALCREACPTQPKAIVVKPLPPAPRTPTAREQAHTRTAREQAHKNPSHPPPPGEAP